MKHGPIRRWWWRWRLRAWQRRLHRLEAEYAARKEYGKGRVSLDGIYVDCKEILSELDAERNRALFQVNRYRNLLNEMPSMRLLDGGKKDEAHG